MLDYVHELKIVHLRCHWFQWSTEIDQFYMQLKERVYQTELMDAIHVH